MNENSIWKNYLGYFRSKKSFSVEFNNEVIKVLQLDKKKKGFRIAGWNKINIPRGIVDAYEIMKPQEFGELFIEAVKNVKGHLKGRSVCVSIPENKVFTHLISVPSLSGEEANEAIKWETESNIPVSIDEVYYDWQIVEKNEKKMKVLVMASPKKVIDSYIRAFSMINFEVAELEAESMAMGRSVLGDENSDNVLIINIGLETTCYAIYQKGIPVFTSSGFFSGKLLTDAISKHFNISSEKAESAKIRFGLGTSTKERDEYLPVMEPLILTMVSEIEKTLIFFDEKLSNNGKESINKIILCGGGSNLRGLIQYLKGGLGKNIQQADPLINVKLKNSKTEMALGQAQSFSTTIGLELRRNENED